MVDQNLLYAILDKEFFYAIEKSEHSEGYLVIYFFGERIHQCLHMYVGEMTTKQIHKRLLYNKRMTMHTLSCINAKGAWSSQLGDGSEKNIYDRIVIILRDKRINEML